MDGDIHRFKVNLSMTLLVHVLAAALSLTAIPPKKQGVESSAHHQSPAAIQGPARAGRASRVHKVPRSTQKGLKSADGAGGVSRAKALLAEVKRDPNKRRYRHHWERAIRALERAARGQDAPVALLEAARARYGLYRFSAVEADRDAALTLAERAARAGSREANSFAAAIHREAGDTELASAKATKTRPKKRPAANGAGTAASRASAADEEEETSDPILDGAAPDAPEIVAEERKEDASGQAAGGPARISEVKTWSNAEYTRVAIYLSRDVAWQNDELASEGDHPRRLVLDFKPSILEGKAAATPVGDAQVQRVRIAQYDPETVRVVLDLAGNDAYQLFKLDGPPRLIVDVGAREAHREPPMAVAPSDADEPSQPAQPPPSAQPLAQTPPVEKEEIRDQPEPETSAPQGQAIRRVVIDAGHGGYDPGAIGPTRVREKDVALGIAKRLAQHLKTAGFEAILTRRGDTFLRLEERTAIANAAHGDLFISIHANAHPRRDRSGIETYFLNVADGRYAARLAARENGVLALEGTEAPQVQRILSDLDANASTASSQRLAHLVQRDLCAGVRSHFGEVRDLGVKSALFYVLLGARMPAVLVETAYISNRDEERRLASTRYQDEIARDLTRAVVSFAGREPRVATVQ